MRIAGAALFAVAVVSGAALLAERIRGGPLPGALGEAELPPAAADDGRTRAREPLPLPLRDPRILVRKTDRRLLLCAGDRCVRSYPIALGFDPVGHKQREGDGRTPEGEYYICVKNARSRYHRSLGISYPNARDAKRAMAAGLITRVQRDRIVRAQEVGGIPPWDTSVGGEIFIHGGGAIGSTRGCIGMDDRDAAELFRAAPVGTPVSIR